ncbi:hypothetical protein CYG68_18595 [Morganella morganii]|uniref:Adhesin n=1 Tax=Morganella morganii TaxID=582 RepID=A0A8I0U8I3_MORMO|nr:hemagglutinin repeat-containing protein [Morganella morganii]MBE8614381.1 hypothetical protein [Morganella morganii]
MTTENTPVNAGRTCLTYLLCGWVVIYPVSPAVSAPVVPDNPATQTDRAGNGVPVINIAAQIFANMNTARGKEKGDGTQYAETTLNSGGSITLNSHRGTALDGAQVSGDKVTVSIGRDLTLRSQQDSDRYDSWQASTSAGISVPVYGTGGGGNLSHSRDKMHSTYDSVQEQTGIFTGSGGYDITVGKHIQLDGH